MVDVEYREFKTHRLIEEQKRVQRSSVPDVGDVVTLDNMQYKVIRKLRDEEHNEVVCLVGLVA